jgi:hypothetical protein
VKVKAVFRGAVREHRASLVEAEIYFAIWAE